MEVLTALCAYLPQRSRRQRRGQRPSTPEPLADPQRLHVEEAERLREAQAEAFWEVAA